MKNRMQKYLSLVLVGTMATAMLAGCGKTEETAPVAEATTEDAVVETKSSEELYPEMFEGYTLKWEDNFDGDTLNRDDWNVELHEPGWVNAELQEYVDSEENIYLQDGKLYLNPVQTDAGNGEYTYTSGRITTQNKHDFTYGMFEVSAKVPQGKGFLPAFWLMSTDENIYGQWPRCGEIDIMEVLGDQPKTVHGTIHYGNPHSQSQGDYSLTSIESFASDFHTYTCQWEPGKITWYVDGHKYHEESDWYSTTEGQGTITYPAPFDQPFYMILNLAVGGSWVGYPDETTKFENNPYIIDYVRVYQKDSYDENVSRPVEEFVMRDPNSDGNYVNNGDFSVDEKLNDSEDWKFLLADGGAGEATIADNMLTITSTDDGNVDYSVQLVQPNIPMQKGSTYRISFDAWASENRTTNIAVKAPDRGWVEYYKTTAVDLTTSKQHYEYEFKMQDASDANGRLEFNNGATGSTGTIYLTNVRVDLLGAASAADLEAKGILADGNYIYNGKFQEGDGHMGFWNVENNSNAAISVTDFADGRRLKVECGSDSKAGDVILSENGVAAKAGMDYVLSFMAESDVANDITIKVGGLEYPVSLKKGNNEYTVEISKKDAIDGDKFEIILGNPGTVLLDDVRLVESALIMNGSFNAGTSGYECYIDSSAKATYVVDSLNEDNALDVTVQDTSDEDWKVQVKQNNVRLVKGKEYTLTFKAKSSMNREIRVVLQGTEDKGWAVYSGDGNVKLTSEYQDFTINFTMQEETDPNAFLSICMGKVDKAITEQHRVVVDDIVLVEK